MTSDIVIALNGDITAMAVRKKIEWADDEAELSPDTPLCRNTGQLNLP